MLSLRGERFQFAANRRTTRTPAPERERVRGRSSGSIATQASPEEYRGSTGSGIRVKRIIWLRRDLRLVDNTALAEAANGAPVLAVYILDPAIIDRGSPGGRRRYAFLVASLRELDQELARFGTRLAVLHGDPVQVLPRFAKDNGATAVYWNRDYTPFAKRRDRNVARALAAQGMHTVTFKDQVVFESHEIVSRQGTPYRVFTPFARAWRAALDRIGVQGADVRPRWVPAADIRGRLVDLATLPIRTDELFIRPGRAAGLASLDGFAERINQYGHARDFPAIAGTSRLSPHLKFGTVSIRECVDLALQFDNDGAESWLNELIWRDFYHMIVDRFPRVAVGNFQPDTERIDWPGDPAHLECWQQGQTGFPIIDAAMRHLARTGWLHNRLRMVVASFLAKDLLLDWRHGEDWFRRQLIDYDFAANNGGWQWAASTGVDAQPYFRVFNPVRQSQRFDPDGAFIRANVVELTDVPAPAIHWPHGRIRAPGYPAPIVDHAEQRERAVQLFRAARPASQPPR
ncbi:MAG: deoxyribodipyrimidine photo-lyase [Candidatus Dadabacteria bacterium]|nr:MAG: deoxyribodipyrimidine photo-lyase [Candidatus Dadabacteria bacterium]